MPIPQTVYSTEGALPFFPPFVRHSANTARPRFRSGPVRTGSHTNSQDTTPTHPPTHLLTHPTTTPNTHPAPTHARTTYKKKRDGGKTHTARRRLRRQGPLTYTARNQNHTENTATSTSQPGLLGNMKKSRCTSLTHTPKYLPPHAHTASRTKLLFFQLRFLSFSARLLASSLARLLLLAFLLPPITREEQQASRKNETHAYNREPAANTRTVFGGGGKRAGAKIVRTLPIPLTPPPFSPFPALSPSTPPAPSRTPTPMAGRAIFLQALENGRVKREQRFINIAIAVSLPNPSSSPSLPPSPPHGGSPRRARPTVQL